MFQLVDIVTGGQLAPGLLVSKEIDGKRHEIATLTGMCEHGLHFGNGCYDFIGRWYVWEVAHAPQVPRNGSPDNVRRFAMALAASLRRNEAEDAFERDL